MEPWSELGYDDGGSMAPQSLIHAFTLAQRHWKWWYLQAKYFFLVSLNWQSPKTEHILNLKSLLLNQYLHAVLESFILTIFSLFHCRAKVYCNE